MKQASIDLKKLAKPLKEEDLFHTLQQILEESHGLKKPADNLRKMHYPAKRWKVLLAEDNEINSRVQSKILRMCGCDLDVVEDGIAAVKKCNQHAFDMIILDGQMPKMGGVEAAKHIRQLEQKIGGSPQVIVAMTASAMPGDREKFLQAGMDDYVPKPVSFNTIKKLIDNWFRPREG